MKWISKGLVATLGLFWLVQPFSALAQTTISLSVPSAINPANSTFQSNLAELPADGSSIVILTAKALDDSGLILVNKNVVVTSNRGEVDTIRCYSGNTLLGVNETVTDSLGIARCAAWSSVAGHATFTATVDSVALNNKPTVTFSPLPIQTRLEVVIEIPSLLPGKPKKTIKLITPQLPEPNPAIVNNGVVPSNERLVNTGINISLPFWLMLFTLLFLISWPILLILVLRLLRKIRKSVEDEKLIQQKEQEFLAKIYQLEQQIVSNQTGQPFVPAPEAPVEPSATPTVDPNLPQSSDSGQNPPVSKS